MKIISIHPLTELFRMFCGRRREIQTANHIPEELAIDAYEQCANEIGTRVLTPIVDTAHKDETCDREVVRLLDEVLADGRVDASEVGKVRAARTNALRSAEHAHDVSELAKFDAK
jgi:hypothetical protein